MKTKYTVLAAAAAVIAFSATASVKVDNLSVKHSGNEMKVAFELNLSDLEVKSDQAITYRPIICNETDTVVLRPVTVLGRNQAIKYGRNPQWVAAGETIVRRANGKPQSVPYSATAAYEPWMEVCDVKLAEDLCGCGRLQEQHKDLLKRIDNTPPPAPAMCWITPKAEAVKARDESGQAFLDFVVNRTDIKPDYRGNKRELAKIINTIDLVKNDPFVEITNINIHGYASPEGTYANNTRLASGRADALKNYVRSLYDLPDRIFTSNYTPEDWANLRKLVEASDLKERAEILQIIDSEIDYDAKDHEIRRRFPSTYQYILKEWYPGLRHSDYKVSYVVRPLTIDEAKEVLKTNPKNLSLNEMFLVAQTYAPGSEKFNDVFETAVRIFPEDPTANLNAACMALNTNDLASAEKYLAKAGDTPEATHARGLLAMKQGRFDQARTLLSAALAGGIAQAKGNMEILDRTERLARENAR